MSFKRLYVVVALSVVVLSGAYFLTSRKVGRLPDNRPLTSQNEVSGVSGYCGQITPSATEGPYYKSNSPERTNLRETGTVGEKLTVTGYVFDSNCRPVAGAWLDFWQADGNGVYDNIGYKLRGHQFTDESGKYILETVMPGEYSGRTSHIHLKVKTNDKSPVLTSQLYFPDEARNQTDPIFNQALLVGMTDTADGKVAIYNFVLAVN